MEKLLLNAFELVVLATNEYANVLEQTTEILKSLDKEKGKKLMDGSEAIKLKLKELELAEERLYKAQRDIK